ncbi:MAG TPA: hypothetical protein VKU39_07180 [Streptosporangiaceae bacterium]|nr:hypothetical protein [Streptosporangiaceae bacterium]
MDINELPNDLSTEERTAMAALNAGRLAGTTHVGVIRRPGEFSR